jgi:hypothetical protein
MQRLGEVRNNLEEAREKSLRNLAARQKRSEATFNEGRKMVQFQAGDTVAVNLPLTKASERKGLRKLVQPWRIEPWTVETAHGDGTYTCRLGAKTKRINQTRIKLWLPSWSDLQRWRKLTWSSKSNRRISKEGERSEAEDSDAVSSDGEEMLRDQHDAMVDSQPSPRDETEHAMEVEDDADEDMDVSDDGGACGDESDASVESGRSLTTRYPLRARPKKTDWGAMVDSGDSLGRRREYSKRS